MSFVSVCNYIYSFSSPKPKLEDVPLGGQTRLDGVNAGVLVGEISKKC